MSGPPPDLLERLSEKVAATPSPTRRQAQLRHRVVLLLMFVPLAIMSVDSLIRDLERGHARWLVVLAWVVLGLVLARKARTPAATAPIGVLDRTVGGWTLLIMIGAVAGLQAVGLGEGISGGEHLPCLLKASMLSLLPLIALLYVERSSDPVAPLWRGLLLGATAGLMGAIPMYLACGAASTVEHAAIGHVVPTMFAAILGALVGARVLALE